MSPLPFLNAIANKIPLTISIKIDPKSQKGSRDQESVGKLPRIALHPLSTDTVWDEIPLGVDADGETVWPVSEAPHALVTGTSGGGKSIIERSIITHCLQHKDHWTVFGIDTNRIELHPYAKYTDVVAGVAKDVSESVEMLRFARDEMTERHQEMEKLGVNNFQHLPEPPKAIMVIVDDAYMLLAPTGIKTPEGKEEDALRGEAWSILAHISRSGRAAGLHLVLVTQRPDAKVLRGELKENLSTRIAASRMDSIASAITLDNEKATQLPGDVKGRGHFQVSGEGKPFQGYYLTLQDLDKIQ